MSLFSRFRGEAPPPEAAEVHPDHQLLNILDNIKNDKRIYNELVKVLVERNPEQFQTLKDAARYVSEVKTDAAALGLAKLVDQSFGEGTFRTLSFLDRAQDSSKSVYKLLKKNIDSTSFEKQVENGYYLNLLETYGVQWDIEKVSRDSLQNFFDANGQTLDGVTIETRSRNDNENSENKIGTVRITAPQDYDWRELIHFGGTTKQDSLTAVGGFGEGLKIAAFVMLKEQGATKVKAGSRDWELEYYFDDINSQAYRKEVKGLHARKTKRETEAGNFLEITFEGSEADKKAVAFFDAQELFYSRDNPDFLGASFNNQETGGFKILPPVKDRRWANRQRGHLYLAGQRTHFSSRDGWETVDDVNIWTWKKVPIKDRDRGMLMRDEMEKLVIPPIIESMSIEDLKKSVYDFKPLWDQGLSFYETSTKILESIVNKLSEQNIKLDFEKEYLANDLPAFSWITDALKSKGYKMCPKFMEKIGMRGGIEQFKEWQKHDRIEASVVEKRRIEIMQGAARQLGLSENELKEVWLFNARAENSVVHGQYNEMFYWMAQEAMEQPFSDALHTYVHEAAHSEGPHGDAKFDYALQDRIQKIHRYIIEHKDEWDKLNKQWEEAKELSK